MEGLKDPFSDGTIHLETPEMTWLRGWLSFLSITSGWSTVTWLYFKSFRPCCEHIPKSSLRKGHQLAIKLTQTVQVCVPSSPSNKLLMLCILTVQNDGSPWGILHCRFAVLHPSSLRYIPERLRKTAMLGNPKRNNGQPSGNAAHSFAVSYLWTAFKG